jgi:hypothetical protein
MQALWPDYQTLPSRLKGQHLPGILEKSNNMSASNSGISLMLLTKSPGIAYR